MSFLGDGKLAKLIKAKDWSTTSIGAIDSWPETLKGYVKMILNIPTPAIVFWGAEKIQIYNDGYAVIMGPRHPTHLGSTYKECWPDTFPLFNGLMERVLKNDEVINVDKALIPLTRHGFNEEAFFTFSISPLSDDSGVTAGFLQVVTEVTEAVIAERRLRTLRALTSNIDDGAIEIEALAKVTAALSSNLNDIPFALLFLGDEPRQELKLHNGLEINQTLLQSPPENALFTLVQRCRESNQVIEISNIAEISPSLGASHPNITRAMALPVRRSESEPCLGVVILGISPKLRFDSTYQEFFRNVSRDIALTFSAERERLRHLKTEEERDSLHRFFMQVPVGICVLEGPDHIFSLANDAYFGLLGEKRDIIGKPLREALPEVTDQGFIDLLDKVYRTGVPYIGSEHRVNVRLSGGSIKEFIVDFVYQPRLNYRGRIDGIVVVANDVTAQVLARQKVELLASDLKEAVIARDEFLSIASHELRTPITSLKLQLQMTQRTVDPIKGGAIAPERLAKVLQITNRQVDRLEGLVEDLLDVAKIRSGKLTLHREEMHLETLIREVTERFDDQLKGAGISLVTELEEPIVGLWDRNRVEQVLVNLLSNTIKYAPGNRLEIKAGHREGKAYFYVKDYGVGVAQEKQNLVFERFERATSSRNISGLGLGLFIVKQIVEGHGGTVTLESALGRGATFTIELPLQFTISEEADGFKTISDEVTLKR